MFNLGMGEITVILLLALIFLGPKKLPELASGLGKLIREIRKTTADVKNEIQLDDAIRKPFEELRDAVTLHPDELKRRDLIKQQMEEVRRRAQEVSDAEKAAAALAGPESSPATNDDVTVVQESPLAAANAAVGDKIIDVSAPPPGTIARGGQGAPPAGATARYGSPGGPPGSPPPTPTDATLADGARPTRPVGLPLPAARRVTPPFTTAARHDATQALTEADLLPSGNAPSIFPPPPPAPSATNKVPGAVPPPVSPADHPDDDKKST
ncbi:MAG TPA: twin-arginine translocase TatA/TatE family subunit [Polyangia bacterium]